MRAGRYDQGADDHLFDVTEHFLGGWLDMLGVECKPLASEFPHGLSLRRDGTALSALFERRCVQVSIQRLRDQDARRRTAGFSQGCVTPMTGATSSTGRK